MSGTAIDSNQRDSIVTIFVLTLCLCKNISIFVRIYLKSQKKNSMHERALKITYNGISTFRQLLHEKNSASFFIFLNKSVSMHHKNFQTLATEMFETQRLLPAKILRKIFVPKTSYYSFYRNYFLKAPSNSNSKLNFLFSYNTFRFCYGMMISCIIWYDGY